MHSSQPSLHACYMLLLLIKLKCPFPLRLIVHHRSSGSRTSHFVRAPYASCGTFLACCSSAFVSSSSRADCVF